jgi:hypothetical protein
MSARRFRRRQLAALAALCAFVLTPFAAQATLIGDTIQGEINFLGFPGINFFDPANGQVPPPPDSSGIQPSAVVIDPDPTFPEFAYTDGTCGGCRVNIHADVDASTVEIREFLINNSNPAINILGWDVWLEDLDWIDNPGEIVGVDITSSDFTGLTTSFTADSVHISYPGGQDIDPNSLTDPRTELVTLLTLQTVHIPEPASGMLVGFGLLGLVLLRTRSRP